MANFYKIADFVIELHNISKKIEENYQDFLLFDAHTIDFSIDLDEFDCSGRVYSENNFFILKNSGLHKKLAKIIPHKDAFVLHSACFDVGGVGIAFAAHSGTGKTTHMNLWQKLLGDKMVVVNGDKPIVRFFEDEPETPYAYGTPWCGKEGLGCNMRTKLQHICFIERSETNYVEQMEKADAIERIFNQVYKPSDPVAVMKTMQLIDRLLSCCKLWTIHCNMEDEAAKIAYNTIFAKE